MGTEAEEDLATLASQLGAENISFVNTLNSDLAALIEGTDHLQFDYLIGDVSDYGISSNGHAHFDLVHNGSSIHCVCFAYRLPQVDADLDSGMQAAVKGDLSYYEEGGSISVIVEDVVSIGDGRYQQMYEENRQLLAQDGLLDPDHKQELPDYPRRIGIATSAESDAREDAVTSIHERYPDVDIVIQNTSVQGTDAMSSMMSAISTLDDDPTVDIIVLTRGGGADKHLRVFNETPLCRVIHNASTPVVVGVGHETDQTLADEVADLRVKTPTQVGEVVPEKTLLQERVDELKNELCDGYQSAVSKRIDTYATDLEGSYRAHIETALQSYGTDLDRAFETLATEQLTSLENRLSSARNHYDQRRRHRQETKRYQRQRRQLLAVLALLVLLVVGLAVYMFIIT